MRGSQGTQQLSIPSRRRGNTGCVIAYEPVLLHSQDAGLLRAYQVCENNTSKFPLAIDAYIQALGNDQSGYVLVASAFELVVLVWLTIVLIFLCTSKTGLHEEKPSMIHQKDA